MNVKLIWRTDVHLSDKSPSSRTDNWKDTVLKKLRRVGELASQHKAHAVIDGGDFFDIKSPTRNSHSLVREVIELHNEYPCPTYANVGNHDCVYGDYSYLHQQPLGVLFSSGCFKRLYDEHEALITGISVNELGFEEEMVVRVVGIPYHGTEYDMERFTSIKKGKEDYLVVVAHVLASSKGGTMFENEDIIKYSDLADLDPDVWMFGHWHQDQGITKIGDKTIVNVGSLTRGSLTQDNMDRIPTPILLDFSLDGVLIERLDLEIKPSEEVFDLERKAKKEATNFTMEKFAESIKESLSVKGEKGSVLDTVRSLSGISSDVKEKATK